MEVYCFGCSSVLDKSTDRRKLVSTAASSNRVLLVWKTLVLEKVSIPSEKLDEVISDVQSPGRICRKCFSAYDRYAKLHTERKSSLDNALPKIPLRCEDRQGSSTPKRTETTARIAPLILPPENIVESPPVVVCRHCDYVCCAVSLHCIHNCYSYIVIYFMLLLYRSMYPIADQAKHF